ncbi:glycoprotein [Changping Tick Virus 2]|uniref:Glycoprotein n=1 Tax=Changping Tick Virus 2 TaxID=1608044 RepID=A0A0B5KJU7_9VIRU|nr:glycoprotein [Changping Tick Virus 2]AJG39045.1 glycoprotein [Changping Tick Virus 2]
MHFSFKMSQILLVLMALAPLPCWSLVAYDCSSPQTNLTAVSLSAVSPCPGSVGSVSYSSVTIQLLQERTSDNVHVRACLVERSYDIFHCGMHSHASAVAGGFVMGEIFFVSRQDCLQAHTTQTLTVGLGHHISGLQVNATSVHTVVELGSLNPGTHVCHGASFELRGVTYTSAVMRSSYKITLVDLHLPLDLKTGKVRTPGGFGYEYKAGSSFDADLGHMYWSSTDHVTRCEPTSYLVLYEGEALIITDIAGVRTLLVNSTDRAMAITLGVGTTMCYHHAFRTEHPKLFVAVKEPGAQAFYFRPSPVEASDVDIFLHINTKLMFLERHVGSEMKALYNHFHQRACEMKQQTLLQLSSIGFIAPEEFAWLYTSRPGVTAITKGEVIYVITCPPVTVQFRETKACYLELPVWDSRNRSAFVKPRSRILTHYGSETDCSPLAPTLYYMSSGWMSFTPHPGTAATPHTMTAEPANHWTYHPLPNLLSAGLYSRETLAKYQERLMFPVSREAVVHTMAAAVAGYTVDRRGLDGARLLRENGLDSFHASYMSRMYGWWWSFSTNIAGIFGILFILGLAKLGMGLTLNCRMLHQTFGWSVKLVASLCGSVTKYLLFRHESARRAQEIELLTPPTAEPRAEPDQSTTPVVTAPTCATTVDLGGRCRLNYPPLPCDP